jgi:hypothetical protein
MLMRLTLSRPCPPWIGFWKSAKPSSTNEFYSSRKTRRITSSPEKKRREEYDALQGSLLARAAGLLQTKAGAARAETVRTLLLASNSGAKPVELHDSDLQQSLLTLPAEEQSHLLQYSWLKLKAPGMADILEKILDQAKMNDSSLRGHGPAPTGRA